MIASPIRHFTENNRWVPLTLYSHRCYGEQTRKYSRRCLSITIIMNHITIYGFDCFATSDFCTRSRKNYGFSRSEKPPFQIKSIGLI